MFPKTVLVAAAALAAGASALTFNPPARRTALARSRLFGADPSSEAIEVASEGAWGPDPPPLRSTPPRRVALLVEPTPFTHVSGYSNRFKELLRSLAAAGDAVEVVTTDDKPDKPVVSHGFPITYTGGFRFPLYNQIMLTTDWPDQKAGRVVRRFKPDIIHASTPGFICVAAVLYAWLYNKPIVLSYHTHLPVYARDYLGKVFPWAEELAWTLLRLMHSRADLTLVTSPQMREELLSNGIPRVDVWRKGIDTVRFNPSFRSPDMRRRLTNGEPTAPLIVYVGRLGAEKKIQLIRPLLDRFPELRLAIVGKGPFEEVLKEEFKGTKTVFTGVLHGDELSQAFASADVFAMPSDSETLGFVVLESMASGVPVVGAAAGGIPNILDDGRTGILFPPNDVEKMGDAIGSLLFEKGAEERRSAMGDAARAEAEKWDWESATSVLRNVQYPKAIKNWRQRRTFGRFGGARWRLLFRMRLQLKWLLGTSRLVVRQNPPDLEYQLGKYGWAKRGA